MLIYLLNIRKLYRKIFELINGDYKINIIKISQIISHIEISK